MRPGIQAQPGLGLDRQQAHQAEQAPHPLGSHRRAEELERLGQLAHDVTGPLRVFPVQPPHIRQIFRRLRRGLIVVADRGQSQQLALPPHRQPEVLGLDPLAPLLTRATPAFF